MPTLSIWEREAYYSPQDVIIVGAGLMGLWSALELKRRKPSLRIMIVERNTTPLGASTRNAGFACFGSPTELLHDAEILGTDAMLSVVEMRYKGIEKIRRHFPADLIDLDLCGGYECINKNYTRWDVLDEKLAWLNALLFPITGVQNIFQQENGKLGSLGLRAFDALIANPTEAALHSGKLVHALSQKVIAAGVEILYGLEIGRWENQNTRIDLETTKGITLSAQQILFSTNAFTRELAPSLSITPARGQVIVTTPIKGLSMKGTFHFDEGFYYWRNLGNRILIGGARNTAFAEETTTDLAGSENIRTALETFLRDHLDPSFQYAIEHHWSGIMAFTPDKKPFVGNIADRVSAAIACNGIGVSLTPVMAEKVAEELLHYF